MTHPDLSRRVAADLLRIGAVAFRPDDPFTWASGLRSPVYCDNRLTLGFPDVRSRIATGLAELIGEVTPDVVAGTATAGIPHAAWVSERLALPMVYVRNKAKAHGRGRQIEGPLVEGRRIALVEDLVSTGGSSMRAVNAIQEEGGAVSLVAAIFSYGLPAADEAFGAAGIPLATLTSFDIMRDVAGEEGRISSHEADSLDAWRRDPKAWSDEFE